MAHYALIDENNIVVSVITGNEENSDGVNWEDHYANFSGMICKRTSINTFEGKHSNPNKQQFRYNYAGIGFVFDPNKGQYGAFISPKPYPSWVLDDNTCAWKAPTPMPEDQTKTWVWDEDTMSWNENIPDMPANVQP
jgi:hypothetical protein